MPNISDKLRQFLMRREHNMQRGKTPYTGWNPEMGLFFPELDTEGHPTIGWGHKITEDETYAGRLSRGVTIKQAIELLDIDILRHQRLAMKVWGGPKKFFALSQDSQDASTALTFQVGAGDFEKREGGFQDYVKFRGALSIDDWEAARRESGTSGRKSRKEFSARQTDFNKTFLTPTSILEDNTLNVAADPNQILEFLRAK